MNFLSFSLDVCSEQLILILYEMNEELSKVDLK